jgi:hypothetical protein
MSPHVWHVCPYSVVTSEAVGISISRIPHVSWWHCLFVAYSGCITPVGWLRHPTCRSTIFMLPSSSCSLRTLTSSLPVAREQSDGLHGSVWQGPSAGRRQLLAGGLCSWSLLLSLSLFPSRTDICSQICIISTHVLVQLLFIVVHKIMQFLTLVLCVWSGLLMKKCMLFQQRCLAYLCFLNRQTISMLSYMNHDIVSKTLLNFQV